jgi:hypothetical protein
MDRGEGRGPRGRRPVGRPVVDLAGACDLGEAIGEHQVGDPGLLGRDVLDLDAGCDRVEPAVLVGLPVRRWEVELDGRHLVVLDLVAGPRDRAEQRLADTEVGLPIDLGGVPPERELEGPVAEDDAGAAVPEVQVVEEFLYLVVQVAIRCAVVVRSASCSVGAASAGSSAVSAASLPSGSAAAP